MNTGSSIIARSLDVPSAFGEIFIQHAPRIHRYVARRVGQAIADDIISETFLIAFERRRRYDLTYPSCTPWLYGIATNLISRHHVHEARTLNFLARNSVQEATEISEHQTITQLDAQLEVSRLASSLGKLKQRDRDVLHLFAWEDFSYEQISAARSCIC